MDELIQQNIREYKKPEFDKIEIEKFQYAAGFSDTDGCFLISVNNPKIQIEQAEKGIDALHFMYDNFGGRIHLHKKGTDKHQTSYQWMLYGEDAIKFAKYILPYLLLKKREAKIFIEFPLGNLHIKSVRLTNNITKETYIFETMIECSNFIGRKQKLQFKNDEIIVLNDWRIQRILSNEEIKDIKEKRLAIDLQIKKFKSEAHDLISEDIKPSIPYLSGVCDGEICLQVNGKSSQHHSITQKYTPILDLFKRLYGGGVNYRKSSNTFAWEINSFAKEFLTEVWPFIVGKKKQVDLILNMKPGEASQIHVKLRELKGKYTASTPCIDNINSGNGPEYKPIKKLPTGVYVNGRASSNRIKAQIQYNKKIYVLGLFDVGQEEEAHNLFLEYKKNISLEKRGGPKVDLSEFTNFKSN
jgi:hypothetical protein